MSIGSVGGWLPLSGGTLTGPLTMATTVPINFGGSTSSFPKLVNSGTTLKLLLADGSNDAGFTCAGITASGSINTSSGQAINSAGALTGASLSVSGAINTTAGAINFLGTTTGIADVMAITASPAITAYANGATYSVKANLANATTTPTININGLGAKTLVKRVSTALAANDYLANMYIQLQYDGTNMVLQNPIVN